jgi:hypothetical protein
MHVATAYLQLSAQLNRDFWLLERTVLSFFFLPLGKMLVERAVSEPL